jgi:DNA polymerase III subunit epsilon
MDFLKRPLAITDIETTGLDAERHEIIDLAVIIVDPETLKKKDEFSTRIKPSNIKTASKKALEISGYTERGWMTAPNLAKAMEEYADVTADAVLVTDNIYFDWSFLSEAFKKTYVEDLLHHRRIDLFTLAWSRKDKLPGLKQFYLDNLCRHFDIEPESVPHRALGGARLKWQVLRKLQELSN